MPSSPQMPFGFRYDGSTFNRLRGMPVPPGARPGYNIFAGWQPGTEVADAQVQGQFTPLLNERLNPFRYDLARTPYTTPQQRLASTAPASTGTNPFSVMSNVKNPAIAEAINAALGKVSSLDPDAPLNVKRDVRSQSVAQQVGGGYQALRNQINDSNQSIADFTKAFLETQPEARALYDQEAGAIGEFYGGADDPSSVIANLNRISGDRARAITGNAQRDIGNAVRTNNIARMVGGDSSYLDRQLMDAIGGISGTAAREKADQDLRNYMAVKDAQARLSGTRNRNLDAVTGRMATPIELAQRVRSGDLSRLATLAGLDLSNTIAEVDSPDRALARQLELLGGVQRLDALNTFYGLNKPYEPNTDGLMLNPVTGGGRRNNGFSYNIGFPPDQFDRGFAPTSAPAVTNPASNPVFNNPVAQEYYRITGQWPHLDPYRSEYLLQQLNEQMLSNYRYTPNIDTQVRGEIANPANTLPASASAFNYFAV